MRDTQNEQLPKKGGPVAACVMLIPMASKISLRYFLVECGAPFISAGASSGSIRESLYVEAAVKRCPVGLLAQV